ncbi:MAG: GNAT family N-acetyltransferase [Pseudonocardiaceae bacterium]
MIVTLASLDDSGLAELAASALTDTRPGETMPTSATKWDDALVEEFMAFHRRRCGGLDGPERELSYIVRVDERAQGVIRLQQQSPDVFEVGIWLARSVRGHGVGQQALAAAVEEARALGARTVVANTTIVNAAAIAALRRLEADIERASATGEVRASFNF